MIILKYCGKNCKKGVRQIEKYWFTWNFDIWQEFRNWKYVQHQNANIFFLFWCLTWVYFFEIPFFLVLKVSKLWNSNKSVSNIWKNTKNTFGFNFQLRIILILFSSSKPHFTFEHVFYNDPHLVSPIEPTKIIKKCVK